MIAYFECLGNDILVNKERQFAASTVGWPMLMTLNHLNSSEQNLQDDKKLLWD